MKFLRFNYQLIWEQQDESACINFPQELTETELSPFIISNTIRHPRYRDLSSFNKNHFELINFDHSFLVEHSEISDSRPYTTSHILFETPLEEHNPTINQKPQQFNIVPYRQQDTTTLQNIPDPSETALIQNVSELSDITIKNPQSRTITNDSNIIQIPVHDITQNPINDLNQNDTTHNTNQDNTSTLSISNTHITQKFLTQQTSPPIYDPLPLTSIFLLKQLHIVLLNKVLLIHKPQMQYNSKQLPQQQNQLYKP